MLAGVVVEHASQVLFGLLHAADLVYEVHVPGGPPELAAGDRTQADVLLHPDRVANRDVLDGPQVIGEIVPLAASSRACSRARGRSRPPT